MTVRTALYYFVITNILATLTPFVRGAPRVQNFGTDVTILFDNDLLGPASPTAGSAAILLSAQLSHSQAASICSELGEQLWNGAQPDTLKESLAYLGYQEKFPSNQQFHIAPEGSQQRAITLQGNIVSAASNDNLPAFCTQTAPFSNLTFQDASTQWQVAVESNNELLTGFRDRASFRFLGIRYAPQPARFTYSTAFKGTGGNANATAYGSECVQSTSAGDEDCLFLNIFTPFLPTSSSPSTKDLKPVMMSIHGGAFTSGTGNDPTFDGGNLASRGDVVMVAINYRLSTLGFLALDDGTTNGNFGFADQINALEWVRANIHNFGGDPDRITIFGQSAGAASVRAMLASPQAIGKFAAAIPQSNLAGSNYAMTYSLYYTIEQEVSVAANNILALTNCTDASSAVDCLREVDAFTLVNQGDPDVARFLVVDGHFLTSDGLPLNGSGPVANVPVLMGFMRDDGAAFIGFPTSDNLTTALNADFFPTSSVMSSDDFPIPPGANATLQVFNVTARVASDSEFRCLDQATAFAAVQKDLFKETFFYEFNRSYQTPGFDPNAPVCNAPITATHPFGDPTGEYFKCHSGELYFTYGNLVRMGLPLRDQNDLPFAQFAVDSWTSFARTYNPNPDPAFLQARGFLNTTEEIEQAGLWEPVSKGSSTLRQLQWPSKQIDFREGTQCDVLGFPLDYFLSQ